MLRRSLPIIILLITALIVAGIFLLRPRTIPLDSKVLVPRVFAVILSKKLVQPVLELYGTVESPQKVELKAPVATYILATPYQEGDKVKKGDRLLIIDERDPKLLLQSRVADVNELNALIDSENTRYKADLESLEHEKELVRLKKKTVDREQHLAKTHVGSPQRAEEAQQALRNQELALNNRQLLVNDHKNRLAQLNARLVRAKTQQEQASLDLQRAQMEAPFNGRVTALKVAVGDRVIAGQSIIEMFDTTEVEIRAQVPHKAVSTLNQMLLDAAPLNAWTEIHGDTFDLKLDRLASEISRRRAGVDALFSMEEGQAYLALGHTIPLFLRLTARDDVYAVPITAIYDEKRLYRIIDEKVQRVTIERIGYSLDKVGHRLALIKSKQLQPGDVIMTSQLAQIAAGMRVDVVNLGEKKDSENAASRDDQESR